MEIKQRFKSYDEFILAFIEQIQLREKHIREARRELFKGELKRGGGVKSLKKKGL